MMNQRAINKNLKALITYYHQGYRGVVLEGSSRSGKTFAGVDFQLYLASTLKDKFILNNIRETYNSFKTTLYDDYDKRLNQVGLYSPFLNKDVQTFYLIGNKINFIGADKVGKVHGAGSDFFFINEALEGINRGFFNHLEQRCRKFWWMDYNPSVSDHWIFDLEKRKDVKFVRSTFLDNPFASNNEKIKILSYDPNNPVNIENRTADDYMWNVYGLGLRASPQGLIFKNVHIIDVLPEHYDNQYFGIDFGYTCFEGNTLISTINGNVKIKDIKKGDLVLTTKGFKKVKNKFCNGIKECIEKEITINNSNKKIIATENHNFNINKKWKKYGELQKTDKIVTLSHLTETNTKDTQMENIQTIIIENGKKTVSDIVKFYIMQFINFIMVKYLKIKLYTISTTILLITIFQILLQYLVMNTQKYMKYLKKEIKQKKELNTQKKYNTIKSIGKKEEKLLLKNLKQRLEFVNIVIQNLHQQTHIKDSVIKNATTNGNINQKKTILNQFALYVQKNLCKINTINKKHAAVYVHTNYQEVTELKTISKGNYVVYDLEVEDVHEYFANGILVHNCDPTAIVEVRKAGKELNAKLHVYTPIDNADLLFRTIMNINPKGIYFADSADPGMISSLRRLGLNIFPVAKFAGSIKTGIDIMKRYKLNVVRDPDAQKEINNYKWRMINGISLNEPIDQFNHFWDAFRYAVMSNCI